FDVLLEGQTMLNDYDIYADRAKIDTSYSSIEYDAIQTGVNTGIVKRFYVDVTGNDGLQIDLVKQPGATWDPLLSAVRIIDNGPARVTDVIISGSNSVHDDYSFVEAFS